MYTFYRKTVEGLSPLTENELEIKENIKNEFLYGRTYSYIKIINDDIILSQNDYLKDWELNELRFVPNKGLFGGCVAKKVDINFNNVGKQFSIQDKEFELYLGVKYNNEEFYIKYGTFIVQHPETEDVTDNTSFTALDYMTKFNQKYIDNIVYPCTLRQLAENICNQAGVILSKEKFRNDDFIVENNQFVNGENLRQVLQGIALSAFSWARVDENNELHFDLNQKEDIDIELTPNEYYNLSKDDYVYGPINRIIIRDSQIEGENVTIDDEESISKNGIIELVIEDNPFAYTQEKREQLIEAARELFGFKYMPINEASLIGFAFLNTKDKIRFKTLDGEVFDTYLFDHTINYNGVILDNIQSKALTKTETKYIYKPELSEKIKRTEIIVNKQEQTITSIVEEQSQYEDKLTTIEQTVDSINQSVGDIIDYKRNIKGVTQIHLTDAGALDILELEINGNKTYENYLFPSDELFPSEDVYPNMEGRELL